MEDTQCYRWIGGNAPDHSTIARFQNERLPAVIEDLFYQLSEKLVELDEVKYENVFVDGTKIEANANKFSFVWAKSVKKYWEKLNLKIEKELPPIALRYGMKESVEIEVCLDYMREAKKEHTKTIFIEWIICHMIKQPIHLRAQTIKD